MHSISNINVWSMINGIASISRTAGNTSLGTSYTIACPPGQKMTGFSTGQDPDAYPNSGYLNNFQVLCQGA